MKLALGKLDYRDSSGLGAKFRADAGTQRSKATSLHPRRLSCFILRLNWQHQAAASSIEVPVVGSRRQQFRDHILS